MYIEELIWLDEIVEKLISKHHVSLEEVEEVFDKKARFRYIERGHHQAENVYAALGRTCAGRYLIVFFIYKLNRTALILSARDMTKTERKKYERK